MYSPISTVKQPLKFFEDLFIGNDFKYYKDNFFAEWETRKKEEPNKIEINRNVEVVFIKITLEEGDERLLFDCDDFLSNLRDKLKSEVLNSKKLILEGVSEFIFSNNSPELYLNHQQNQILKIINNNTFLIKKYPTILENLKILSTFINELLLKGTTSTRDNDEKLVDEIFAYFKDNTNGTAKIMSEIDYLRLKKLIIQMLKDEKVPLISTKFPTLAITNTLLTFTFYVLHVEKYGIKPRRFFITQFLKDAFKQYEDTDIKTLNTKFSVPPQHLLNTDWIPEIIKRHKTAK